MEIARKALKKAVELMEAGVPFALCTVSGARGSVPGKVGAKMVVLADGTQFGTVGGAGVEEKVKEAALRCIAERKGGAFKFDLAFYKEGGLDSLCGGTVEVFIEYMPARPHVLICGGGHVGLEVAKLCDQLDYGYSVLDDRPEFSSRQRFPNAQGLFSATPSDFFPKADLSAYSHVVILGYSHRIDTDAVFECARRFPGWIGVIGSKAKRHEMFLRLKARGVTEEELARVELPVGMAIGSESAAECAVSILGSVIRHHKLGPRAAEKADVGKADRAE